MGSSEKEIFQALIDRAENIIKEEKKEQKEILNKLSDEQAGKIFKAINIALKNALLKQVANNKGLLFFYTTHKDNYDTWYAFSQEENRIVYEFLLQNDDNWTSMNITQLTDNGNVVLALYNKTTQEMLAITYDSHSISKGNSETLQCSLNIPESNDEYELIAYIWDDFDGMKILGSSKKLN